MTTAGSSTIKHNLVSFAVSEHHHHTLDGACTWPRPAWDFGQHLCVRTSAPLLLRLHLVISDSLQKYTPYPLLNIPNFPPISFNFAEMSISGCCCLSLGGAHCVRDAGICSVQAWLCKWLLWLGGRHVVAGSACLSADKPSCVRGGPLLASCGPSVKVVGGGVRRDREG